MPGADEKQKMIDAGPNRSPEQVDILFQAGLRTFDWTIERSRHFDIKASIVLALYGILLIPAFEIYGWKEPSLFVRLVPIITVVIGTIFCILAILPRIHLEHPPLEELEKDYTSDKHPLNLKADLYSSYKKSSEKNIKVGEDKIRLIIKAQILALIAFYLIVLLNVFRGVLYGR